MLEDDEIEAESITLLPPTNACGDVTDEDSGDEDYVDINNLPSSQMQNQVELNCVQDTDGWSSDDDLPLTKLQNKVIKKRKEYHYEREDLMESSSTFVSQENFNFENNSPYNYYVRFIDDEFLKIIVEETNRYASQKNKNTRIELPEMKCFLGVLLLSGYLDVPRRRMYWEQAEDTHNRMASQAISRDKFEFIMSHIHFSDNTNLDRNDKFAKVRPFFNQLNQTFLANSFLEEDHSVDEAMVPYYGKHGCKQFIHGKPIRYGYKLWVGTTKQGYINWFEPYQGATTNISTKYKDLGVGTAVILEYADRLREKYPNFNFQLYFDNFFSSIPLLENLTRIKMYGTGTIRENRIPSSTLIDSKELKKKGRGCYDYMKITGSNIIFIKWNDNNIVTFCSNSKGVYPLNMVRRYSQKEKKFVQVEQPNVVKFYNKGMGGVDRSDQNISLYRTSVRGKKWYFPLVSHCVDMCVHNAWQLYKHEGGKLDHLGFRRCIATVLLTQNKKKFTYQRGRPSENQNLTLRYDRFDHMVIPQDKQTRCASCHQKTTTRCEKCDVGLHVKCFKKYHT